jgi:hypothetical protein
MNQNSDPLDYLIECCETYVNTGKCNLTRFTILNAKDELRRLREEKAGVYKNVAWVRINDREDLYDPRLIYNSFVDESTIIPLYSNIEEFKAKYGNISK